MKKLLLILISVSIIAAVFCSCGNTNNKQAIESTTADVTKIDITAGIVKGGSYTNKSLGFKVIKPENLDCQDYGDLVLTEDDADFELPDYFLLDNNYKDGEKALQIEILDKNYSSIDDWKNEIIKESKKAEQKDNVIIGYREYTVIATGKKVMFATFNNGKLALITFKLYSYEEAMDFITQNFKAV